MESATALTPSTPKGKQAQELRQALHDIAGSLSVLMLCLPTLSEKTLGPEAKLCRDALSNAKRALRDAWRTVE
jgi:hypothetical protein